MFYNIVNRYRITIIKAIMKNRLINEIFPGLIKIHVLYHAGKEDVYGILLKDELKRHGYHISFGTLYPILHRLEKERYLKSENKNINGKIRRYYHTTKKGEIVLEKAKEKVKELIEEIFSDEIKFKSLQK